MLRYRVKMQQRRLHEQAAPPAATAPAKEEIVNVDPETIVKKPVVKKTKAVAENSNDSLGAAPVVLVPPSDPAEGGQIAAAPIVVDQPIATQPAPVVKKKKTLIGLFKGTNDDVPAPAAQPVPAAPEQQVAAFPSLHQSSSRPHQRRSPAPAAAILFSSHHSNPKPKPAPSLAG